MHKSESLKAVLQRVDALLDIPTPEIRNDQRIREMMNDHAANAVRLEEAIRVTTEALQRYPLHPALLLRRGIARGLIRFGRDTDFDPDGAKSDLSTILETDPENIRAAGELLHLMFVFSMIDDDAVAEKAAVLVERAAKELLDCLSLQMTALGYARRQGEAYALYERWSGVFSERAGLEEALREVMSMDGTRGES